MYFLPCKSEWSVRWGGSPKVPVARDVCGGHCDVPRSLPAAWAESACCLALCLCSCLHLLALSCWVCILQGNWGKGLCFCCVWSVSVIPRWCKTTTEKVVTDFKFTLIFVAFTCYLKTTCADFSTSCSWYLHVMHLIQKMIFNSMFFCSITMCLTWCWF